MSQSKILVVPRMLQPNSNICESPFRFQTLNVFFMCPWRMCFFKLIFMSCRLGNRRRTIHNYSIHTTLFVMFSHLTCLHSHSYTSYTVSFVYSKCSKLPSNFFYLRYRQSIYFEICNNQRRNAYYNISFIFLFERYTSIRSTDLKSYSSTGLWYPLLELFSFITIE